MEKVDILGILQVIDDYILIKKDPDFPRYSPGSDLDLVVFDREAVIQKICEYYTGKLKGRAELEITDIDDHCHLDFVFDGELDIRIDLIDNFRFFNKLEVKPSFLVKLFKDRKACSQGKQSVWVPSDEDDLTLRYFEYLEWFEQRPDKIKHLDYIMAVEDPDLKARFFENTHCYIQFKPKTWNTGQGPPPSPREAYILIKLGVLYLYRDLRSRLGIRK